MREAEILSPLAGWCLPLTEVPDQAFAGGMLGTGLAIDPTEGLLVAPCAGTVVLAGMGRHALTLRLAGGLHLLIHVGIDTVRLEGRGFELAVRDGQQVAPGDLLLRFDLDSIARGATSLVTPLVAGPNGEAAIVALRGAGPVRRGDALFRIVRAHAGTPSGVAGLAAAQSLERNFRIDLPHGLHARPAARIARALAHLQATVSLEAAGRSADARSVVSIMSLGVAGGQAVVARAGGRDAGAALDAIAQALEEAQRAERAAPASPAGAATAHRPDVAAERATASEARTTAPQTRDPPELLRGTVAVGGHAVGTACRLERLQVAVAERGAGAAHERAALERARTQARSALARSAAGGAAAQRSIMQAHLDILDDPALLSAALGRIDGGASAGHAWRGALEEARAALAALADERLRERAADLRDLETHVLLALDGSARAPAPALPADAVLLADDLLPSEIAALDRSRLRALALEGGGATSHVAILAAAYDIPMLVAMGTALRGVPTGAAVIVDGEAGTLRHSPAADALAAARARVGAWDEARRRSRSEALQPALTRDGTRIAVHANLAGVAEAAAAMAAGAEGCGLLRTEFLFIDRATAPPEDEQLACYQAVADALGDAPLVLRLMDAGGDKPLPYLASPHEDNPALGLRGVRTLLRHPGLLRSQLRAALAVQPPGRVRLLLPMVTGADEIASVRALLATLAGNLPGAATIAVGAMIETPAAALAAGDIAREADFMSIGSNDLAQYALAMDRTHAELAARVDALHPAVLQLIAATTRAAAAAGRHVAVCGAVAADPEATALLVGLGVDELSVVPGAIPALKQRIRALEAGACRALAQECLALGTAQEVRAAVRRAGPAPAAAAGAGP